MGDLGDASGSQPSLDGSNIGRVGGSVSLNLLLGEPLAVVLAGGVGDVEQLGLEALDVVLLKTNGGLHHGSLVGLAGSAPAGGNVLELTKLGERSMLGRGCKDTDSSGGSQADLGESNHIDYFL